MRNNRMQLESLAHTLRSQSFSRLLLLAGGASVVTVYTVYKVIDKIKYRRPPGPWGLPLLGNINVAMASGSEIATTMADNLYNDYGGVITINAGPVPMVLVLDSDLVLEALLCKQLSDRMSEFYSVRHLTENMNSIFSAPSSPTWRLHRKLAHSAFRIFAETERLESLVLNAFDSVKHCFTDKSPEPVDLYESIYLTTYNLQCRMAFGKEYSADDQEFRKLRACMESMNEAFTSGLIVDILPVLRFLPLQSTKKFLESADFIIDWMKSLCEQHQQAFNPNELNDILDFLVNEQNIAKQQGKGDALKDVHLRQTMIDIFFAGTDTTALTLYWVIMALCKFPAMQARCYEEIVAVCGADSAPTLKQRKQLPYTDAFLHEVMRYWPVAATVPRQCSEDFELGGYTITKGMQVILSNQRCANDPRFFPEPREFKPERFLESDGQLAAHKRGFIPFGAGVRVCLGETIAKRTTFLLTALLIQNFLFHLPPGQETLEPTISEASSIFTFVPRRFNACVVPR